MVLLGGCVVVVAAGMRGQAGVMVCGFIGGFVVRAGAAFRLAEKECSDPNKKRRCRERAENRA